MICIIDWLIDWLRCTCFLVVVTTTTGSDDEDHEDDEEEEDRSDSREGRLPLEYTAEADSSQAHRRRRRGSDHNNHKQSSSSPRSVYSSRSRCTGTSPMLSLEKYLNCLQIISLIKKIPKSSSETWLKWLFGWWLCRFATADQSLGQRSVRYRQQHQWW